MSEKITRSFLRYFGGKFAIGPWIVEQMPPHHIYVEPFGGGASVLLLKPRSYAEIYNDLDGDICNAFRVMRDDGDKLIAQLQNTPFAREEYDLSYHDATDPLERARRTIVRSWMGFGNSTQRACGKTGFQAKHEHTGSTKAAQWAGYQECLGTFKDRLAGVVVENRDALEVIDQQDTDKTLFFVDPPYVPETRLSGTYAHELTREQHEALCEKLRQVKGMVMLSGYDNEIYARLGWHKSQRTTTSMASTERTECLWLNPACVAAQSQQSLFGVSP